jgi:protein-tyrosine phosphatase
VKRHTAATAILSPMRVLFVCMGNICRSPTAKAVMLGLIREAGLQDAIEIDSAGTGPWYAGDPPDRRATVAARERGVMLDGAARQITRHDFEDFDLLLAMDRENLHDVRAVAPDDASRAKVRLLREYDPEAVAAGDLDVPDPYHGGPAGFERVLDLVEAACRGLLADLRAAGTA